MAKKKKVLQSQEIVFILFCPHSLLTVVEWSVRGATGTQQHSGHTAFHVMSQCIVFSHVEKVKAFCTEKMGKDP